MPFDVQRRQGLTAMDKLLNDPTQQAADHQACLRLARLGDETWACRGSMIRKLDDLVSPRASRTTSSCHSTMPASWRAMRAGARHPGAAPFLRRRLASLAPPKAQGQAACGQGVQPASCSLR